MSSHPEVRPRHDPGRLPMTLPLLAEKKRLGDPIVMVTAYDYPSARAAESAGVDLVLVGDSAATTVLGYSATTPVAPRRHARARARRAARAEHADADRRPAVRLLRGLRRAGDHDGDADGQGGRLRGGQARGRRRGVGQARARDRRRRNSGDGPRRPDAADGDGAWRLEGAGTHRRRGRADRRRGARAASGWLLRARLRGDPGRRDRGADAAHRDPRDRHRRRRRDGRPGARLPRPARHPRRSRRSLRQALREHPAGDERRRRRIRRGRSQRVAIPARSTPTRSSRRSSPSCSALLG